MVDALGGIPSFNSVRKRIFQEFIEREYEGETQESIATAYRDYVLKLIRIHRGAIAPGPRQDAVDHETMGTLKNADLDDPQLAYAVLTFQRLAVNPTTAIKYIERLVTARQTKISKNMSTVASNQRLGGRKPFAKIIDEIVRNNPSISCNRLLQELRKHEETNVIDDKIICYDPHDEMTIDALRGALSRSRKRMSEKQSR